MPTPLAFAEPSPRHHATTTATPPLSFTAFCRRLRVDYAIILLLSSLRLTPLLDKNTPLPPPLFTELRRRHLPSAAAIAACAISLFFAATPLMFRQPPLRLMLRHAFFMRTCAAYERLMMDCCHALALRYASLSLRAILRRYAYFAMLILVAFSRHGAAAIYAAYARCGAAVDDCCRCCRCCL